MTLALGLMSGTSGDGVSLALCSFSGKKYSLHREATFPYPAALRKEILRGPALTAGEISRLHFTLGHFFAACALKFLKPAELKNLSVIGSHGQTIYHGAGESPANTLQIGEASILAEKTGAPVVMDFRVRDIAAGGRGAPLIPFFDEYFFGGGKLRALQNIGGIANVTLTGADFRTLAFDNGPGNCLIDLAAEKLLRSRCDTGGKTAAKGKVRQPFVKEMAGHAYFRARPPKSTGRELFKESFIPKRLWKEKKEDIFATLTYFTAFSIADSYRRFLNITKSFQPSSPKSFIGDPRLKHAGMTKRKMYRDYSPSINEVIVSGGGALNVTLMKYLKELLPGARVGTIEEFGIPLQAKEPMAFAFFAVRALHGEINHCPAGTGARKACVLGKIIPAIKNEVESQSSKVKTTSRNLITELLFNF